MSNARANALATIVVLAGTISCSGGGDKSMGPSAPTVATVTVSPTSAQITVGGTQQLSASAVTSTGTAVSGLTTSWSSSANAVATVTANGLVTAVATGSATITATAGGVSGSAAITVISADFAPTGNVSLSGTQKFATLTIPAGVTVTVSGDLDLQVSGAATVSGTLKGDCVKLHLMSGGALTATGNISNACSAPSASPPDLQLVGSSVSFTNDTISSAGQLFITNDTTLTSAAVAAQAMREASARGPSPRSSLSRVRVPAGRSNASTTTPQGCSVSGGQVTSANGKAGVTGQFGTDGGDARSVILTCRGDLLIAGANIFAGNGGVGGDGKDVGASPAPNAIGGKGGRGGQVMLSATGNLLFGNNVTVSAGLGGQGGAATASSTVAGASATATGGKGGDAFASSGDPSPIVTIRATLKVTSTGAVLIGIGGGGVPGAAKATGTDGANASNGNPAQKGGSATATGGNAGSSGGTVVIAGKDLTGFSFEWNGSISLAGGAATAIGGKGGSGDAVNVDGATGGNASANGGAGETTTTSYGGAILKNGGRGGFAFLEGGGGGNGTPDCVAGSVAARGGNGGNGGNGFGSGGAHGLGAASLEDGTIDATDFALGTNGVKGFPPGAGGLGGFDNRTGTTTTTNSFKDAAIGPSCPSLGMTPTWTVPPGGDPNGHSQYVNFQSIQLLTFSAGPGGLAASIVPGGNATRAPSGPSRATSPTTKPIIVTGASPWVTITGTIATDGTISAQGYGTVAGYSNVLVQMNGKVSAGGAFTGTVVAGNQTPQTLPGGSITYGVTGTAKSP